MAEPGSGITSPKPSRRAAVRPGTLYVVATPLGNMEDITLRALRVLGEVDVIAAEDTRHSRKLLTHYGISTRVTSYHDQIERRKAPKLVAWLHQGKSVALISDAGTPGIADPGYQLVGAAIAAGVRVEAVPGPSAVAAALSVAGLRTDRFAFDGFIPAKPGARRKYFVGLAHEPRTIIVYEAARRLRPCLHELRQILGDRQVVVARELTKMFEEIMRGSASDVLALLEAREMGERLPGEVTLLIEGGVAAPPADAERLTAAIVRLRGEGLSLKEIARALAREHNISRREVYQAGLSIVQPEEEGGPAS
jgi:16S rRNA (cytidine1402-2'-O)-methyltransferase